MMLSPSSSTTLLPIPPTTPSEPLESPLNQTGLVRRPSSTQSSALTIPHDSPQSPVVIPPLAATSYLLMWAPSPSQPKKASPVSAQDILNLPPIIVRSLAERYAAYKYHVFMLDLIKARGLPLRSVFIQRYQSLKLSFEQPWEIQKQQFIGARIKFNQMKKGRAPTDPNTRPMWLPFGDLTHVLQTVKEIEQTVMKHAQIFCDDPSAKARLSNLNPEITFDPTLWARDFCQNHCPFIQHVYHASNLLSTTWDSSGSNLLITAGFASPAKSSPTSASPSVNVPVSPANQPTKDETASNSSLAFDRTPLRITTGSQSLITPVSPPSSSANLPSTSLVNKDIIEGAPTASKLIEASTTAPHPISTPSSNQNGLNSSSPILEPQPESAVTDSGLLNVSPDHLLTVMDAPQMPSLPQNHELSSLPSTLSSHPVDQTSENKPSRLPAPSALPDPSPTLKSSSFDFLSKIYSSLLTVPSHTSSKPLDSPTQTATSMQTPDGVVELEPVSSKQQDNQGDPPESRITLDITQAHSIQLPRSHHAGESSGTMGADLDKTTVNRPLEAHLSSCFPFINPVSLPKKNNQSSSTDIIKDAPPTSSSSNNSRFPLPVHDSEGGSCSSSASITHEGHNSVGLVASPSQGLLDQFYTNRSAPFHPALQGHGGIVLPLPGEDLKSLNHDGVKAPPHQAQKLINNLNFSPIQQAFKHYRHAVLTTDPLPNQNLNSVQTNSPSHLSHPPLFIKDALPNPNLNLVQTSSPSHPPARFQQPTFPPTHARSSPHIPQVSHLQQQHRQPHMQMQTQMPIQPQPQPQLVLPWQQRPSNLPSQPPHQNLKGHPIPSGSQSSGLELEESTTMDILQMRTMPITQHDSSANGTSSIPSPQFLYKLTIPQQLSHLRKLLDNTLMKIDTHSKQRQSYYASIYRQAQIKFMEDEHDDNKAKKKIEILKQDLENYWQKDRKKFEQGKLQVRNNFRLWTLASQKGQFGNGCLNEEDCSVVVLPQPTNGPGRSLQQQQQQQQQPIPMPIPMPMPMPIPIPTSILDEVQSQSQGPKKDWSDPISEKFQQANHDDDDEDRVLAKLLGSPPPTTTDYSILVDGVSIPGVAGAGREEEEGHSSSTSMKRTRSLSPLPSATKTITSQEEPSSSDSQEREKSKRLSTPHHNRAVVVNALVEVGKSLSIDWGYSQSYSTLTTPTSTSTLTSTTSTNLAVVVPPPSSSLSSSSSLLLSKEKVGKDEMIVPVALQPPEEEEEDDDDKSNAAEPQEKEKQQKKKPITTTPSPLLLPGIHGTSNTSALKKLTCGENEVKSQPKRIMINNNHDGRESSNARGNSSSKRRRIMRRREEVINSLKVVVQEQVKIMELMDKVKVLINQHMV